jgi:hypothetical protein
MIVVEDGAQLRLVTQSDHAHLAAELLSLWPALADLPERDLLLRATRRHDNGWQRIDAAPPVDEQGRPHDFLSLPWELRLEIWDRGTAAFESEPEVALLIVEHALTLHLDRIDTPDPEPLALRLIALLTERRRTLREQLGARGETILALYPWLRIADLMSLLVVNHWTGGERRCEVPGQQQCLRLRLEGRTLLLDPFPFAGATIVHYSERRIERRAYRDRVDLGTTLALATWESDSIRLRSWRSAL